MPSLEWTNKPEALKSAANAPFRLLDEVPELSYGDEDTENMIIQGDNLDGLKALLPLYAGQVKCIYIDPPYNTKSAFEHYDDNLEHSTWLSLIYPRLELLRDLLSEDGIIWISIDDNEVHYLKVIMDEIFGRKNFIATIIWQKLFTVKNSARHFSDMHDFLIVYAKNSFSWQRNLFPRSEDLDKTYSNPDNDPRGAWTTNAVQARNYYSQGSYEIHSPSGKIFLPPKGTYWRISEDTFLKFDSDNLIWWGKDGNSVPRIKKFLSEAKQGVVPSTIWFHKDCGTNAESKMELRAVLDGVTDSEMFITPKPEKLIKRIFEISTNPNDLVLDSFLGSGTTAAVAHKMNRRYIGIEMGDHAQTHCAARLKKVIDGEQGGISKAVNWTGGGGFRFYKLGAEIFLPDGKINPDVKFKQLASFIWFKETKQPIRQNISFSTSLIGIYRETAYYILYNGILKERSLSGGNVLTRQILKKLPPHNGLKIIYGDSCSLNDETLKKNNIAFRQIPYEVQK